MSSLETSPPVSASTFAYLMRWPVFLLIWLKLIFSESDVAGYKATGQVTRAWEHDPARSADSRIEIGTHSYELFTQLRLDGKPALIFASHLANWELPALAAVAHGLVTAILHRQAQHRGGLRRVHCAK